MARPRPIRDADPQAAQIPRSSAPGLSVRLTSQSQGSFAIQRSSGSPAFKAATSSSETLKLHEQGSDQSLSSGKLTACPTCQQSPSLSELTRTIRAIACPACSAVCSVDFGSKVRPEPFESAKRLKALLSCASSHQVMKRALHNSRTAGPVEGAPAPRHGMAS